MVTIEVAVLEVSPLDNFRFFLLFSNARSCYIWTQLCWFLLENGAPACSLLTHGRADYWRGRAIIADIECAFFSSISIPNFVFLPCFAIQVIVSNSNVVYIMHRKMDISEFFEFFKPPNPSNKTGEGNIAGEDS